MKPDESMLAILGLCEAIDSKAAVIYHYFSDNEKDPAMKDFWYVMSEEEKGHLRNWRALSDLAHKGDIRQLFDNPQELEEELRAVLPKLDLYLEKSKDSLSLGQLFTIGCALELFMLHRSFVALFYFMQSISPETDQIEGYEAHLTRFINQLDKCGCIVELDILVLSIKRLWKDNKALIITTNEDPLTGVFNRRGFSQTAIPLAYMSNREKKNVAVMMIDADKFKAINDKYGHKTGDEVLRFISQTIKNSVRHSDIVGRYGGEEFLVFLPEVDKEGLFEVAEKVRREIERDNKMPFPVTVSIGFSYKVLNGDIEKEFDELIGEADDNLYKAKETGRNRVFGKLS